MTLLAYFGHHKAASTWIASIIDVICADTGWNLAYLPEPRHFDHDLPGYVAKNKIDFISFVNARMGHIKDLPEFRGFHVVRDPRDVIASGYFSHLSKHPTHDWPELIPHRKVLQSVSKEEGMLAEIEFSEQFLKHMSEWDYNQENVLELRQEEFTASPYRGFLEVFEHLGVLDTSHYNKIRWPGYLLSSSLNILRRKGAPVPRKKRSTIPGERVLGCVYDQRFEKYAGGRKKGETDNSSHYRKGQAGDWRNHFDDVHVEAFKARYGDLVERLGYGDW